MCGALRLACCFVHGRRVYGFPSTFDTEARGLSHGRRGAWTIIGSVVCLVAEVAILA